MFLRSAAGRYLISREAQLASLFGTCWDDGVVLVNCEVLLHIIVDEFSSTVASPQPQNTSLSADHIVFSINAVQYWTGLMSSVAWVSWYIAGGSGCRAACVLTGTNGQRSNCGA